MRHKVYETRIRLGFTVMTVIIGCIIFSAFWLTQEREMMYNWVTNAREMRGVIRDLRAEIIEAESSERGYILTGVKDYSRSYDDSCTQIHKMLQDMQRLSIGNVHQQESLPELHSDVNKWIGVSRRVIQLSGNGHSTQARQIVASGVGKSARDRITARLQDMSAAEDKVLAAQTRTWNAYSGYLAVTIYTLAFTLLGMLWLAYRALRTAARKDAMFEAATEGSMDGFFLLEPVRDADGKIADFTVLDTNNRTKSITGKSRARIVGKRMSQVLPRDLRECMISRYVRAIEVSHVLEEEFPVDSDRPECRWIRHQIVPLDNGVAVTVRDVTEQKILEIQLITQQVDLMTANERLEGLSVTDYLTDLKNNRALHEKLAEEVLRAVRYGEPLSLVILDIDRFKQYNDTFGHPAGDDALRQIADILKASARATDFVARYGGEEFAVILPQTDHQGAVEAAERFRSAIEQHAWEKLYLTASVGAATFHEEMGNVTNLVNAADQAMYASKSAGRNRITHADDLETRPQQRRTRQRVKLAI